MTEPGDLMSERYGGARRRWPVLAGAVVALAALGWLAWAVWAQSTPKVTSALQSFHIGEHTSTATLQVHLSDTDVRASCLVRATASDHTVVGELHFTLDNPDRSTLTITRTIRTERRPTTIESVGCTAAGQQRPR